MKGGRSEYTVLSIMKTIGRWREKMVWKMEKVQM